METDGSSVLRSRGGAVLSWSNAAKRCSKSARKSEIYQCKGKGNEKESQHLTTWSYQKRVDHRDWANAEMFLLVPSQMQFRLAIHWKPPPSLYQKTPIRYTLVEYLNDQQIPGYRRSLHTKVNPVSKFVFFDDCITTIGDYRSASCNHRITFGW